MKSELIQLVSAEQVGEYRLCLCFSDGRRQEVDFKPFLSKARHPDLRAYLAPERFATFRVEYGDLVWGDYDLCFPVIDLYRNALENHVSSENIAA
ncbi:DUF2442 domain-containing protein [Thiohalocapsa marina]|uniref:DUF2442 domain-containing protein n=1 Tax=Thiohalocapsa marina TaxID=424902 RepID=A0A5M8FUF1_9GAMM|nr:DUF2442 domain-containing protein [Thiohalocapsa marina]KAA6187430.1 DUF2442 domain-containing protein [Thiohalocapsa marina]